MSRLENCSVICHNSKTAIVLILQNSCCKQFASIACVVKVQSIQKFTTK